MSTLAPPTRRRRIPVALLTILALGLALPARADDKPKEGGAASSAPIGKSSVQSAASLLDQLKSAKDATAAHELETKIWQAWTTSGNADIDKLMQQASILMQIQQFDNALSILDTIVAKAPDFAEGWNKRATLLYVMHDYDRSMSDIQKVLTLEPRHFGAIAGIGLIRLAKGDPAGAVTAYKKVLEIDPQNIGAQQSIKALGEQIQGNPI